MDRNTPFAIGKDVKKIISFHFGMYRYQAEHFDHNEKKETPPGLLSKMDNPAKRGTKLYRFIDWPEYNQEVATAIEFDSFLDEDEIKKRILADTLKFQLWDPEDFRKHFLKFENDAQARFYYVMKHINKRERVDHGYPECEYPFEKCPVCGGRLNDDILEPEDVEDVFNSFEGSGPDGDWSNWEEIHRCPHCGKRFFIHEET